MIFVQSSAGQPHGALRGQGHGRARPKIAARVMAGDSARQARWMN